MSPPTPEFQAITESILAPKTAPETSASGAVFTDL
jgi:hypothetical protein